IEIQPYLTYVTIATKDRVGKVLQSQINEPDQLKRRAATAGQMSDLALLGAAQLCVRKAPDKALALLRKIEHPLVDAVLTQASAHLYRNDFESALSAAKKAVSLDPRSARAYLALARVYDKMSKDPERLAALQSAAKADPNSGPAHNGLGTL